MITLLRLALPLVTLVLALTGVSIAQAAPDLGMELRGFLPLEFGPGAVQPGAQWYLPPVEPRSVLRMVHLVGLCLGFGTAMMLDGGALLWIRAGRAPAYAPELLGVGSRLVLVGFALLWASGIALTALAVNADPAFLQSPKLWAKVAVVSALTANAMVLHAHVLPPFAQSMGRTLDGQWRGPERALFVASGAVSSASWLLAFALGVLREWNHTSHFGSILVLWLVGILTAAIAIQLLLPPMPRRAPYLGPDRRRGSAVRAEAGRTASIPVPERTSRP